MTEDVLGRLTHGMHSRQTTQGPTQSVIAALLWFGLGDGLRKQHGSWSFGPLFANGVIIHGELVMHFTLYTLPNPRISTVHSPESKNFSRIQE